MRQLPGFDFLLGGRNGNGRGGFGGGGESNTKLPPLDAEGKTMMAIMAHPDDIDFGSAGSIAKWCDEGWTVYYVLATSGDKGTHDPRMTRQELAALREEEQRAACRVLGVKDVFFLGYPDGFLPNSPEVRGEVVRLFRIYKPNVVLTWDGFRTAFNHSDHRNIGIAVRDAVYPAVRDHLYYPEHTAEGLDAHRVNEMLLAGSDKPDFFVDISNYVEKKVDAMLAHASQVQSHDRNAMLERIRRQGARRGGRGGLTESFKRVRTGRTPEQERERQAERDRLKAEAAAAATPSS